MQLERVMIRLKYICIYRNSYAMRLYYESFFLILCFSVQKLFARKSTVEIGTRVLSTMADALKTHEVVPDVIDKVPNSVLDVTYANNLKVEIGKVLTPTQVKDPPSVKWDAESGAFYTLCMTGK